MSRLQYKAVLTVLLAVVSSSAMAEWVEIGSDETITIYADPATIHRQGNKVKMWDLGDFKIAEKFGDKSYMSVKQQQEYDCKRRKLRVLLATCYSENMGKGETICSNNKPRHWEPVLPVSFDESMWEIACKKR